MGQEISKDQVKAEVTARVVKALEEGTIPWHKPWAGGGFGGMPLNPTTSRPYNGGLNVLLLWFAGFSDHRWMGFGQARKKGWTVRKGQKSTAIYAPVFGWGTDDNGERFKYVRAFRVVRVFNAEQVAGVPTLAPVDGDERTVVDPSVAYDAVMALADTLGVPVSHGGSRAFYRPGDDRIGMPAREAFISDDAYLSTLLHEMVHSTGHKSRLDRGLFGQGVDAYAQEELVAEMGAAFLCGLHGITRQEVTQNHEAYIAHWIKACKDSNDAFYKATVMAWRAAMLIQGEDSRS